MLRPVLPGALALALALPLFAQPNFLPLDDYLKMWRISKQFTVEVAAKMPADQYGFKPTPEEMAFGTLMVHIAGSTVFRFNQLTGAKPPFSLTQAGDKLTKEEIVTLLGQSFDYVLELLPKMTPAQMDKMLDVQWRGRPQASGRQMMLNMFTHVAHHRAQAEVYLRLKGIAPPVYTF